MKYYKFKTKTPGGIKNEFEMSEVEFINMMQNDFNSAFYYEKLNADKITDMFGDDKNDWPADWVGALNKYSEFVRVQLSEETGEKFYAVGEAPSEFESAIESCRNDLLEFSYDLTEEI